MAGGIERACSEFDLICTPSWAGGSGVPAFRSVVSVRSEQPKVFDRFWKQYGATSSREEVDRLCRLFRERFPSYRGKLPICRENVAFDGEPDDPQIMDEPLFRQLKKGFSDSVDYSYEITEPNVICTEDTDDFEWPKNGEESAKLWVVVIDYHF